MSRLGELYNFAKVKVRENKRGLAIATGYTAASNMLIPGQAIFTVGLAKVLEHNTVPVPWLLVGLAALNIASIATESTVLNKKSLGNSIPSSTANLFAKEILKFIPIIKNYPFLASIFASTTSHLWHFIPLGLLNPLLINNFNSFFKGDEGREFFNNFASISTILTLWNLGTYYTIHNGTADKITDKINEIGKKVNNKVIKPVIDKIDPLNKPLKNFNFRLDS